MNKMKEVKVNNEIVYLKKGFLGWHVAYPQKINGKINWKNLIAGGDWWKLLIIAFIVLIILGCVYDYSNAVKIANECLNQLNQLNVFNIIN